MRSAPPLPLPPDFPLPQLLSLVNSENKAGAWFRGSTRSIRLHGRSKGRCLSVLLGPDLGFLLRHCSGVVVREGGNAVLLPSELLIQWRALQVVTGTPYLPCPHHLKELFPESEIDDLGFQVPTRSCPPEAVLADCLTHGIPVAQSRIVYCVPTTPVDATQPATLR